MYKIRNHSSPKASTAHKGQLRLVQHNMAMLQHKAHRVQRPKEQGQQHKVQPQRERKEQLQMVLHVQLEQQHKQQERQLPEERPKCCSYVRWPGNSELSQQLEQRQEQPRQAPQHRQPNQVSLWGQRNWSRLWVQQRWWPKGINIFNFLEICVSLFKNWKEYPVSLSSNYSVHNLIQQQCYSLPRVFNTRHQQKQSHPPCSSLHQIEFQKQNNSLSLSLFLFTPALYFQRQTSAPNLSVEQAITKPASSIGKDKGCNSDASRSLWKPTRKHVWSAGDAAVNGGKAEECQLKVAELSARVDFIRLFYKWAEEKHVDSWEIFLGESWEIWYRIIV